MAQFSESNSGIGLSRRGFCGAVAASAAAAFSAGAVETRCKNILLITTDDQGLEAGCYGDPSIVIPEIDGEIVSDIDEPESQSIGESDKMHPKVGVTIGEGGNAGSVELDHVDMPPRIDMKIARPYPMIEPPKAQVAGDTKDAGEGDHDPISGEKPVDLDVQISHADHGNKRAHRLKIERPLLRKVCLCLSSLV